MKQAESAGWRTRLRRLVFAVANGWLELFTALPILAVAVGIWMDGSKTEGWLWITGLAGYTLGSALVASLRWLRWTGVLIIANGGVIFGWAWLIHGPDVKGLLSAVMGIILAVRATQLVRFGGETRLPSFMLWIGLAACAPAVFLLHRAEGLEGYADALEWIGLSLFAAAIFLSNGSALADATYGGRHVSAYGVRMRRFNRLLVLGFGLPILAISFWGVIDGLLRGAGRLLVRLIGLLLASEGPPPEALPSAPPQTQNQEQMRLPEGEAAWIWVFLERVMMIAFTLALVVAAAFLLRELYRRLPGWLRAAGAWIAKYRGVRLEETDTGYVDEVSSIRDGRRDIGPWSRLKQLLRPEHTMRWEELRTNGERVRYLYALAVRRSVRQGFRWRPQWTPAETAAEAAKTPAAARLEAGLCEAYEQVRYGGAEPGDADIARWKMKVDG